MSLVPTHRLFGSRSITCHVTCEPGKSKELFPLFDMESAGQAQRIMAISTALGNVSCRGMTRTVYPAIPVRVHGIWTA